MAAAAAAASPHDKSRIGEQARIQMQSRLDAIVKSRDRALVDEAPEPAVRRKSMVGRDPHAIHIEVAIHKLSDSNKTHAQGRRQSDHALPSSVVDEIERIRSEHATSRQGRRSSMPSFQTDVNFSRVSSEPAGDKQHQCAARQLGAQNAGKGQLHAGEGGWRPTRANFFGSQDIVAPKAKEFALDFARARSLE